MHKHPSKRSVQARKNNSDIAEFTRRLSQTPYISQLLAVWTTHRRCCQIFQKRSRMPDAKIWNNQEVKLRGGKMASVHDCDYARELITHSREVKCSRGQKNQLDPPVVWAMARVRNVSFWYSGRRKTKGVRQGESNKLSIAQKCWLLSRGRRRKKEWEIMD